MALFHGKKRAERGLLRLIAGSAMAVLALVVLGFGVRSASENAVQEGARVLADNLRRASVQCYALQGFYPPNVAFLEENYSVTVDDARYAVHYECFASNLMPDITVVLR